MRITAPELEIAVLVLGMVILMVEAFAIKIDKRILAFIAITGLAIVFVASFFVAPFSSPNQATGFWSFYTADRLSIFFKQFALLTTILVLIMMIDYAPVVHSSFPSAQGGVGEFFAIPIFTCAGLMYLVSAIDFVFIFVSLELVTISFYVLVSFTRRNPITLEAGTKYLVLSTVSTAFLVYGIAWLFGVTGQTNLHQITQALANPDVDPGAALLGMAFVLVALGFKIAAVPFQIWVPDVYQGAPTPVTAYLSVGSKAAGFVVLLRVLLPFLTLPQTQRLIVLIALLTLIYGNLAALPQANLKRLLAYSSIAHAGYLLIGVVCFDVRAVTFFRNAGRDGLTGRCPVYRGIFRQVLHLLCSSFAAPNHAGHRRRAHCGLRILLLSQSCSRHVLAVNAEPYQNTRERALAPSDQRLSHRHDLAGRLPAADF